MPATLRSSPVMQAVVELSRETRHLQLGPTIRDLGRLMGTDDPLAGGDWDAAAIRVRQSAELAPYMGEVVRVEISKEGTIIELHTPVLNWIGANGVLPYEVSGQLLEAERSTALTERLDRSTHKLVACWYRTWLAARGDHAACSRSLRPSLLGLEHRIGMVTGERVLCELDGAWIRPSDTGLLTYDPTAVVRITVGPASASRMANFMPPKEGFSRMLREARALVGPLPELQVNLLAWSPVAIGEWDDECRFDLGIVYAGDTPSNAEPVRIQIDRVACRSFEKGWPAKVEI